MKKRSIIIILVSFIMVSNVNSAHAQFWKKWFNKDEQTQQAMPAKEEKASEPAAKDNNIIKPQAVERKNKELPYKRAEKIVEKQLVVDSNASTQTENINEIAKKAIEGASQDAKARAQYDVESDIRSAEIASESISKSEKEEQLRQTQERVNQIKRTQDFNSSQRSLDNIKRINEMNRQQKRVNDINKFNKQQENLDNLRQLNDTKK